MFVLALLQMRVAAGQPARNIERACKLIGEAASNGAKIVLLPEAMDVGWTDPSTKTLARPIPDGETARALIAAAKAHRIYVCSGLIELAKDGIYNAAILINPEGEIVLHHRKLNELEIGHGFYAQGDRLGVCKTEFGIIGLMICADGFARDRVISRSLGYMGADVILSPSAWAVPADHDNARQPYGQEWRDAYIPVAKEFSMWIAGASNVGGITGGPWAGRNCIGCSLVIGPDGREVVQGPYGEDAETILYVDIEPVARPARGCGWERLWTESPESRKDA